MASGNIRGITIEFGGDTRNLESALNSVNTQTKSLQTELKAVERGLKFDPGNVELVRQRQELLTQSISDTSERLGILRTAQAQVQQQYDSGEIPIEQYRAFQRELQTTEGNLNRLQNSLSAIDGEQERLGQSTRDLQTLFDATGTSINDFSSALGTRLTSAIRDGSASADQLDRAIRIVGQQALGASTDVDQLRVALRQIDDGGNIQQVRRDLSQLANEADQAGDAVNGFGDQLTQVAGGLAAGGGIAGIISQALDVSGLDTKIDITLDVPEESRAAVRDAIVGLQAYGLEGEEALEGVRRQFVLNKDATDEANAATVRYAGAIANAYSDIDFKELIQETNEISAAFKITDDEALGLVNNLLRVGFPPDQLDIISEYGSQLARAGFTAEQIQATFAAGVDTGTYNIDILLDGLQEGRLRLTEFGNGVDENTAKILQGTGISTQALQEYGAAVARGGEEGQQAYIDVANAVAGIDDALVRNTVGVALFGTLYEQNGDLVTDTLVNAQNQVVSLDENQKVLNQTVEGLDSSPAVLLSTAMTDLQTALKPVLDFVAQLIAQVATWASENTNLVAIIVGLGTTLGILAGAFVVLLPAIGGLVTALPILTAGFAAISAPIVLTVTAIGALGVALIAAYNESETFRSGVSTVFESIQSVATNVFKTVADFIGQQVQRIRAFWDENGAAILQAAETAFNGIMAVVDFVMPAIQFVIDYVWKAIQNVITGALDVIMGAVKTFTGVLNGDFSTFWKGIQQIFSGAIDLIVGLMSLSFVGGIRNLVTNLFKTLTTTVKTQWTTIANTFKSFASSIPKTVGDLSTATINTFRTLGTTTVNLVKTMATNLVSAIKDLPQTFLQVGKDIVNGMVNGIKSINIVDTVKGLANSVLDTAKNVLGIKSPSREFMKIGDFVGQGLEKGIDGSKSRVQKSIEELSFLLIDVAEDSADKQTEIRKKADADILKLQQDSATKIANLQKSNNDKADKVAESNAKKKKGATDAELRSLANARSTNAAKIVKIEQDMAAKINSINTKANSDAAKAYADNYKNILAEINLYISDKKSLDQLTLVEEATIWERSIAIFEEGSKERVEAQKAYQKTIEDINKQVTTTNQKYVDAAKKIDDDFVKNAEALTKNYTSTLDARQKSLYSFAGTFDFFDTTVEKSGQELLENLNSQVKGFEQWQQQIQALSERAIDDGLLAELTDLGPKALAELKALNSLTDDELNEYSDLYREKSKQAREQAEKELQPLEEDTRKQIEALRNTANVELSKLESDWVNEIKGITQGTQNELKTLESIGKNAVQGLINGLNSLSPQLQETAKKLADTVSDATRKTLDIRSPSRVMRALGEFAGQGLILGLNSQEGDARNAAERIAQAIIPDISIGREEAFKQLDQLRERLLSVSQLTANDRLEIERKTEEELSQLISLREQNFKRYADNVDARDSRQYLDEYFRLIEVIKEVEAETQKELEAFDETVKTKFNLQKDYVDKLIRLNAISLQDEYDLYKQFLDDYESGTEERLFFEEKSYEALEKIRKQRFEDEKKSIEDLVRLNRVSSGQQITIYERLSNSYKKGTEEQIFYEERLGEARQKLYVQLSEANEDYAKKISDSNKRLIDGERELNETYEDSVKSRTDSLFSFAGIFDKVEKKSGVTGARLLRNLQGQVDTFKKYQENLDSLSAKGLDENVLAELRRLGPDAATEIAALNTLSSDELDQYAELFQEKYGLARSQAEFENIGLKNDTLAAIEDLRRETARELDLYADEWKSTVEGINKVTTDTFNASAASTPEIGAKIIEGLQNGLSSMTDGLYSQVQSIADNIRSTIQSALNFAGASGANLSSSVSNASEVLSTSALASPVLRPGSALQGSVDNSRVFAPNVTINTTQPGTQALDSTLRRLAFQF